MAISRKALAKQKKIAYDTVIKNDHPKGGMSVKEKNRYWKWGLTAFLTIVAALIFYDTFYEAGVGGTLQHLWSKLMGILAPILYGAAMAYLLNPIVKWFEKIIQKLWGKSKRLREKKVKRRSTWLRTASILLTWALVLLAIYLIMDMLIPQLIDSVTLLAKNARAYYYKAYRWADEWLANNQQIGAWANDVLKDYYTDAVSILTNKVLPWATEVADGLTGGIWNGIWSVVNFAKNLIIGLIVSIYLLAMKEQSLARCCKLTYAVFKKETADLVMRGGREVNRIFSGFINGKVLDSVIIGILCWIGCSILKIPYAPLVGLVVGVTNVIPFFGPFLGAIPSALLILIVSPRKCLIFLIFILILQQFDGNILSPKILGGSIGISSFWVIVAILVGGGVGGVLGMFLGVPVCGCVIELVRYLTDKHLKDRDMPTEAYHYTAEHRDKPEEKK